MKKKLHEIWGQILPSTKTETALMLIWAGFIQVGYTLLIFVVIEDQKHFLMDIVGWGIVTISTIHIVLKIKTRKWMAVAFFGLICFLWVGLWILLRLVS